MSPGIVWAAGMHQANDKGGGRFCCMERRVNGGQVTSTLAEPVPGWGVRKNPKRTHREAGGEAMDHPTAHDRPRDAPLFERGRTFGGILGPCPTQLTKTRTSTHRTRVFRQALEARRKLVSLAPQPETPPPPTDLKHSHSGPPGSRCMSQHVLQLQSQSRSGVCGGMLGVRSPPLPVVASYGSCALSHRRSPLMLQREDPRAA